MDHPEQALALIDRCPSFSELSLEARRALAACCREVEFAPGEIIVSTVEPLTRIMIILDGRAKLIGLTEEGIERILIVYHPGDVIGSRILLDDSPESAFEVGAIDRVKALAFPKPSFLAVTRQHPEVLISVTALILRRLDRLMSWMLAAMSNDASIRLARILLDFAAERTRPAGEFVALRCALTHESMAQMIGASRPHTTTLLADLEELGLVRRLRPRGLLVNPGGLSAFLAEHTGEKERLAS